MILEILNFIFKDFLHFVGMLFLISVSLNGIAKIFTAIRGGVTYKIETKSE